MKALRNNTDSIQSTSKKYSKVSFLKYVSGTETISIPLLNKCIEFTRLPWRWEEFYIQFFILFDVDSLIQNSLIRKSVFVPILKH
jgi:hypothetical protein